MRASRPGQISESNGIKTVSTKVFSRFIFTAVLYLQTEPRSLDAIIGVSSFLCKNNKAALHVSVSGAGSAYLYVVKKIEQVGLIPVSIHIRKQRPEKIAQ